MAEIADETEIRLTAPAPGRPFTILIASAASFDKQTSVVDLAVRQLDAAASRGYPQLWRQKRASGGTISGRAAPSSFTATMEAPILSSKITTTFSVCHGVQFARQISAKVQRHDLEYWRRPAYLGCAALVRQYELLITQVFVLDRPSGTARSVFRNV